MNQKKVLLHSLLYSLGVVIYAMAVAWIMNNGNRLFGQEDTYLSMAAFLLLFVLSASVVGMLIFGKPAKLFMDGLKKESLELLFYIVGWLFVMTLLVLLILAT